MSLLHQVLFDLYKHCRDDIDEIIVVDDYSQDEDLYKYYVDGMMIGMLPVTVIKKEQNDGFLKTCNLGVREAMGDIVVVLSNDVRVLDNVAKQVKRVLEDNNRILIGNRHINYDSGWNTFDGKTYNYLEGWFLACTKDGWNELGGFDEQYGSSDFEDVDLSTTAVSKGFVLLSLDNSKIMHNHPASSYGYNPEREARTKENREKFKKKWLN